MVDTDAQQPRKRRDSEGYTGTDRRGPSGDESQRREVDHNGSRDWTSLKAWAQAIGYIGIPGAIALGVVYVGATQLPQLVRQMDVAVIEIRQSRDLLREHDVHVQTLIRLVQKACMNSAKDDIARQNCFEK